ncbi:Predicted transcriptional regulator [uncultured Clostridium sp.]|nr:helix-turn-helix transcriptional regulator [Suonthocola fibrivorans]MCU6732320.1 helix-turn-helix transcriptional regulator [Suonthocola fibrivorans]SCI43307.1 Predicted transcriptional regulator [uncultured Clostridium sp.]
MDLQTLLDSRKITKYHLSKISGVPKTTVMDICSGKSSLHKCSAKTVQQLARALDCTMEDIMELGGIPAKPVRKRFSC